MQKRWYDLDPTVSLAVSLMKNANEEIQLKCADYITRKSKNNGVKISDSAIGEAFNTIFRRWYDKDKRIQEAFEYLKTAPLNLQREIAKDLLNVLQIS